MTPPPTFLHLPTDTTVTASGPRVARYRRNHNFIELGSPSDSPDSYEDGSDSPASSLHDLDTAPDSYPVPAGTVAEILAWVGDDADRARVAIESEEAGLNRITLLRSLRRFRKLT